MGLTLYTRPGCILCAQVREQLRQAEVPFRELEALPGSTESEWLKTVGVPGFPALFLGERYIGGFTHVIHLLTEGRLQAITKRTEV